MTSWRARLGILSAVLALSLPALAEETVDSIEKKLTEAAAKIKAVSFKLTSTMDLKQGEGGMKTEMVGTCDSMRAGEKAKFRIDMKSTMAMSGGDQPMKMENTALLICDGEFVYTLSEMMGQKSAIKSKPDPSMDQLNVKHAFEQLRKEGDLKILADEKVDGRDCFVIEATTKAEAAGPFAKQIHYYAKDLGFEIKVVQLDKDGKTVGTTTITDVKLDPTFPPDHFTFKAPEGVTVMDMTKEAKPE